MCRVYGLPVPVWVAILCALDGRADAQSTSASAVTEQTKAEGVKVKDTIAKGIGAGAGSIGVIAISLYVLRDKGKINLDCSSIAAISALGGVGSGLALTAPELAEHITTKTGELQESLKAKAGELQESLQKSMNDGLEHLNEGKGALAEIAKSVEKTVRDIAKDTMNEAVTTALNHPTINDEVKQTGQACRDQMQRCADLVATEVKSALQGMTNLFQQAIAGKDNPSVKEMNAGMGGLINEAMKAAVGGVQSDTTEALKSAFEGSVKGLKEPALKLCCAIMSGLKNINTDGMVAGNVCEVVKRMAQRLEELAAGELGKMSPSKGKVHALQGGAAAAAAANPKNFDDGDGTENFQGPMEGATTPPADNTANGDNAASGARDAAVVNKPSTPGIWQNLLNAFGNLWQGSRQAANEQ